MTISQFVQVPVTFNEVQRLSITLDYCLRGALETIKISRI